MDGVIRRRTVIGAALAAPILLAVNAARAHTPYKQWVVYRRKHLLIGCHRQDPDGYTTAKQVVGYLDDHLPAARARVARAPAAHRLASLLGTDQLDLAVMEPSAARAMRSGGEGFASVGAVEIETLVMLGDGRALVVHARFNSEHAALVADALLGSDAAPRSMQQDPPCPWHEETLALLAG